MDQFNKIEIQGMVGAVRVTNFTDGSLANISVATNYLHRTRDNQATVETTWFNVLGRIGRAIEKGPLMNTSIFSAQHRSGLFGSTLEMFVRIKNYVFLYIVRQLL